MSDEQMQGQDVVQDTEGEDGELGMDPAYSGTPKQKNRNAFVLSGLAVVGALVVWFMYFRHGPASAQAATGSNGTEVRQFLEGDNLNKIKQTLKDTDKLVTMFKAYPGRNQIPIQDLKVNPFRELAPAHDAPAVVNNRDEEREAEIRRSIVKSVGELHLQSIIRGRHPACMIDNTLYTKGEKVGRFTIEQITSATVVIRCDKYRFELRMQS